jgi:hypothetical protein
VPLLAILVAALLACAAAGSRAYRPISEWEAQAFSKADRNIYPHDVRRDIRAHTASKIAWPGLVQRAQVVRQPEKITLIFDLEHHYYDWVEDFHPMNPPIWLSPRGEGQFRTSWDVRAATDQDQIEEMTKPGYLVIVYGAPTKLEGETIVVDASYIRGISQRFYTTGLANYGRETTR